MGRIIAVNSNCYHGYSIEQAIDGIAAAGFRYIEAGRKGPHPLLHERPL